MKSKSILSVKPLGFMWPVKDPFLFCAHHLDDYPAANEDMGPAASLTGRNIGQDFTIKDGWRMYHGDTVPGFPEHPHRGFETVTIVLRGTVDHADSHGQAGRYANGDVQWMTAGAGLQHSEMFPLLDQEHGNTAELFQVWLNLPKAKKMAKPYFRMLWSEDIPVYKKTDKNGKSVEINVISGDIGGIAPPLPAPDSWAANPDHEVAIWTIKMEAGAIWSLPAASSNVNRTLFFYRGSSLIIDSNEISDSKSIDLIPDEEVLLVNGDTDSYLLLLQGIPINEPVVQYGPFVMNSEAEIQQAFYDYKKTEFGGWPWPRRDMVHSRTRGRFAKYDDGSEENK